MRIPRFFIDRGGISLETSTITVSNPDQVHQIVKVLRLRPGAVIDVLDGRSNLFKCILEEVSAGNLKLSITEKIERPLSPHLSISVFLPLIKPSRFEWAIEKLTELGVDRIIPLVTERTVAKIQQGSDAVSGARQGRWRSIAREASEQSERLSIPDVVAPTSFAEMVDQFGTESSARGIILAERRESLPIKELCRDFAGQDLSIVVGPEGGFSDREFEMASESILTFVSLGEKILRSETAAIYAVSLFADL